MFLLQINERGWYHENQSKNQFSPIIENVIYDGLNYQLERITKKNRGEKNE